jgi:hypothetical protein
MGQDGGFAAGGKDMSKDSKYGQLFRAVRILWLVLWGSVLLTGCISRPPKDVEVIVPARDKPTSFQLPPDGQRMTYQLYPHKRFVMDFTTGESIEIHRSCWTWLTGTKLKCGLEYVLDINDFSRIELSQVNAEEVPLLLDEGYAAYWDSTTGIIVLLPSTAIDSGYYYRLEQGSKDTDSLPLLAGHPYTTINMELPMGQGVSPDGRYYYDYSMSDAGDRLRIHATADDRVVAEYKMDSSAHRIRLGGWVYDSSGVIFQEYAFGYGYGTGVYPIAKLKVPDEP